MGLKQPIPTNLKDVCNGNEFAATVMEKLILRAKSEDGYIYPNGEPVFLKIGQCFCGRFELARCFGLKRSQAGKIQRILDFLQNSIQLINKQKSRNGSIITILNYGGLTNVDEDKELIATFKKEAVASFDKAAQLLLDENLDING